LNQESDIFVDFYVQGTAVSDGIAIGNPIFLSSEGQEVPEFPISIGEVEHEITRYRQALMSSREDLKKLQANLSEEGSREVASIIGTHIEMLDDPLMTTDMESKIGEMLKNTEAVFKTVIHDYESKFSEISDGFFKQRLTDVKDLSQRVLRNLCDSHKVSFAQIPQNAVVFTKELIPSDTAAIQASQISAFVTQSGGGTSHAALIARAKGIPYVTGVNMDIFEKTKVNCVIVDGRTGTIVLNPSFATIEKYVQQKKLLLKQYQHLEKEKEHPTETLDGYRVELCANISHSDDMELAHHHRAKGIGLFRSEYLFLKDTALFFDEKRQIAAYQNIFNQAKGLQVTFRVMDLGGDKYANIFPEVSQESNGMLGCRGIRFLLQRTDVFKTQLRAVLQAAVGYSVKILLPLISDIQELRDVRKIIQDVKNELRLQATSFLESPSLGCMLEVPSAILICDTLAEESDFLALGTNDLVQYTLGIDRGDSTMATSHYPTHPGIIRMIRMTLLEAKRHSKPVTVCGEMASNPLFTALLLGLGVRRFSCAPRFIPIIKRVLRHLSILDAVDMAEHVLTLKTSSDILSYLRQCFKTEFLYPEKGGSKDGEFDDNF
jgi:phosphoenolpyruvate-protein phosphotransferase (PTS system enzyme I)